MKKRLLILLLLITSVVFGENKYILWRVEGDKGVAYLAPTVHLLSDDFYPLNPKVEDIFDRADKLVVEVDITSTQNIRKIQENSLKYMYNEGMKGLHTFISEDEYETISKAFEDRGLDLKTVEMLKPYVLSQQLLMMELMQRGYAATTGLDVYLINKAKEQNKSILELETVVLQMELFSSTDDQYFIDNLVEMADYELMDQAVGELDKMVEAVKNGDLEEFEEVFETLVDASPEDQEFYEKLLDQRNIAMADKIDSYLKTEGVYFVAVGGGHYIGNNNIRDLLEEKGYEVERVELD